MWFPKLLLLVLLVAILSGCATGYLSAEENEQMSQVCGPDKDCAVIKGDAWRQIERALKMCGFGEI